MKKVFVLGALGCDINQLDGQTVKQEISIVCRKIDLLES